MTRAEALELAESLELDAHDTGICLACLFGVSLALASGDEREIRSTVSYFAEPLWAEGLALPARLALERALVADVPHAAEAIDDIGRRGHRSPVARAIVRHLAEDLLRESDLLRG